MKNICPATAGLGYSPEAYHKKAKHNFIKQVHNDLIIQQVHIIRKEQPDAVAVTFNYVTTNLEQHNISIGRDHFFELLRRNKLLVRKTKRSVFTTNSKHHFHRHPNLSKNFTPLKVYEL